MWKGDKKEMFQENRVRKSRDEEEEVVSALPDVRKMANKVGNYCSSSAIIDGQDVVILAP